MANNNDDNSRLLLLAGGGLLVYFGIVKPILVKIGVQKDPEVIAKEKSNNQLIKSWQADTAKKQKPTKSEAEWKIIADQIYEDLRYSWISDNDSDAAYQICRVQNDADVAMLFTKFAKRQEYWFGINAGSPKALTAFVVSNLDKKKIAAINDNYRRKGIKFRF